MAKQSAVVALLASFLLLSSGYIAPGRSWGDEGRNVKGSCHDSSGKKIDCPGTGRDADIKAGLAWPAPRFIDNEDGTVTDNLSGIMWLKDANCFGKTTWLGAQKAVSNFNRDPKAYACNGYTASHADWLLPNVNELESMTNAQEADTAEWLLGKGFKDVRPAEYWSSTSYANPYSAWTVNLLDGSVKYLSKITQHHVWPIRFPAQATHKFPRTGQQESSAPYDDGATKRGVAWPEPRFTDNGDGTVLDTLTGLMWLQDAGCFSNKNWQSALETVSSFNANPGEYKCKGYAGRFTDWRLPNKKELRSLIDYSRDYPALPKGTPIVNIRQSFYWLSTTSARQPDSAYGMEVIYGMLDVKSKTSALSIWPVRSAAVGPAQLFKTFPAETVALPVKEEITEPEPFTDNGDGTITDNTTGLMWLKDGYCMGKLNWPAALKSVEDLNNNPDKYAYRCVDYAASYNDWKLPDITELESLVTKRGGGAAGWLKNQGFVKVQSHNYWTSEANRLNLYYAWLVSVKHGERRNYSKEFEFYVWPVRKE